MTEILQLLDDNHIYVALIPPNCTDRVQLIDLSVSKPAKDFWNKFRLGTQSRCVLNFKAKLRNLLLTHILKPLGAKWMIALFNYLNGRPKIITNGFKDMTACIDN